MKVIIIGGSAGGASAAARLRRLDEKAEILMLERGPYISYANCGLPYYVGDVIREKDSLLIMTPEMMQERFRLDIRTNSEATAIDAENKTITVLDHQTGRTYQEHYDKLILATGSTPFRPRIPGIGLRKIHTLWTVPDAVALKEMTAKAKSAVILGGGFIGLEIAENLLDRGLQVTIADAADQILAPLDPEMAHILENQIRNEGAELILQDGVTGFEEAGDQVRVSLKSGRTIQTDLVVLSIGTRPNTAIAAMTGIRMTDRGFIEVDRHMRTSDENIYAVGDIAHYDDIVTGQRTTVGLAGPANREARIAADHIAGIDSTFRGTQGSSVVRVFHRTAASTGASEKTLQRSGLRKGLDYEVLYINPNNHPGYYPDAQSMMLKLIFARDGSRIYGAQIIGGEGTDKRLDVIATVIRLSGGIEDLEELELSYSPIYNSPKDPVNMAGFVAHNMIRGLVRFSDLHEFPGDAQLLDVREEAERMAYELPGSIHIPLGTVRDRWNQLDPERPVVVFCAVGQRAYNAARILMQYGFKNVMVYPGGMRMYRLLNEQPEEKEPLGTKPSEQREPLGTKPSEQREPSEPKIQEMKPADNNLTDHSGIVDSVSTLPLSAESATSTTVRCSRKESTTSTTVRCSRAESTASQSSDSSITIELDCSGLQCPGPLMKVHERMQNLQDGDTLQVQATDPGFTKDMEGWCRRTGNTFLSQSRDGSRYSVLIRKGTVGQRKEGIISQDTPDGKTIIVFSGDFDKVMASFIIANGAAAMGRKVTMFFTFWGLTALRRPEKVKVKKSFMESMFGFMLPRGVGRLGLSRMNMGGLGTRMMKKIMREKNVESLESLIQSAQKNGVRLQACSMSMDVMGIHKEELIDGVEIVGVGSYLASAEEANVNLFM